MGARGGFGRGGGGAATWWVVKTFLATFRLDAEHVMQAVGVMVKTAVW